MKKITILWSFNLALASAASAQTKPTEADLLAAQKKYDDAVKLEKDMEKAKKQPIQP